MTDEERNENTSPKKEPVTEPAQAPVTEPEAEPVTEPAQEPAQKPAEEDTARFVYHWKENETAKKAPRSAKGAIAFGAVMLSAFLIALTALIAVLIFLPGNGESDKIVGSGDRRSLQSLHRRDTDENIT